MLKLLALTLFTAVVSISPALAAPLGKGFKGIYQGSGSAQNITGQTIFYSPTRIQIAKNGKVTGTALLSDVNSTSDQVLTVKGKIKKVVKNLGGGRKAKLVGTFSDGAKWTGEIIVFGSSNTGMFGKVVRGDFRGNLALSPN
jgi:hypothetical protein